MRLEYRKPKGPMQWNLAAICGSMVLFTFFKSQHVFAAKNCLTANSPWFNRTNKTGIPMARTPTFPEKFRLHDGRYVVEMAAEV